jgi:hypothetical protein
MYVDYPVWGLTVCLFKVHSKPFGVPFKSVHPSACMHETIPEKFDGFSRNLILEKLKKWLTCFSFHIN